MGFPCNQFGAQEPGTAEEIRAFVTDKYDVDFPMFEKIEVNGDNEAPLYTWLKEQSDTPENGPDIAWNFTKFLVSKDGSVVKRFEPMVTPEEIGAELGHYL